MADIVITGINGYIKIVFNDSATDITVGYFNSNHVAECVALAEGGVVITFATSHGMLRTLQVCFDGSHGLMVDSVGGVVPSNDTDLCDKIGALIKS